MKATTFIHAIAAHNWDTIPAQIMHILNRYDLSKVIGTEGKIHAIGINGIPESNYLYLFPEADQMQADFYHALQEAGQTWENNPYIADAVCTDAAGQLIVIINVMEG